MHKQTTVFYGKRIIESSKIVSHLGYEIAKKRDKDIQQFEYYILSCLDMCGGDIQHEKYFTNAHLALNFLRKLMIFDGTKCGTVCHESKGKYAAYLKNSKKTNPTLNKEYHHTCTSLLYGRSV